MGILPDYGDKDYSPYTYGTISVVLLMSFVAMWRLDLITLIENTPFQFQSNRFPDLLLAIFRTACFLLSFYTILILMVRSKIPGKMTALRHKERDYHFFEIFGIERLVTFSSWTLIMFGLVFLFSSIGTWCSVFGNEVPDSIRLLSTAIYPLALCSAFLTSTVVRYIIIPSEIEMERDLSHLFLPHEIVMHNLTVILLAVDLIATQPNLRPEFGLMGVIMGIIYVIFAYIWANYGGRYYVYSFIEPRVKGAPMFLIGLAFSIGLFYLGLWLIVELMNEIYLLGVLLLCLWVKQIIMFKQPIQNNNSI
ncbi:MAG: hypothetical protein GWO84_08000 [Euryarchaeota archaeon]|nr:hypothetical protein [Euryarchaeota archaeon]